MSTLTIAPSRIAGPRSTSRTSVVHGDVVRERTIAEAPRPAPVRLTHRGRVVVLSVALAITWGGGFFLGSQSAATDRPGSPSEMQVVTVTEGATLWDIAATVADDGEIRSMVDRIQTLNGLEGGMVFVGQRLRVPTGE